MYTFDVHMWAKIIQFIHSMYMRMRNLFNLYSQCTCVYETYSIYTFDVYAKTISIHTFDVLVYTKTIPIHTFDVHVYTKTIPIDSYIRCTCVYENYIHSYIRCTCVYENYTHWFIHSMYMCIRKLYPLILTFDVHVYTKTIPIHKSYKVDEYLLTLN
jgi:hypothetical protein